MSGFYYTDKHGKTDTMEEQILKDYDDKSDDFKEGVKAVISDPKDVKHYGPYHAFFINTLNKLGTFLKWSAVGWIGYWFGKLIIYIYLISLGAGFLFDEAPDGSIAGSIIALIKSLVS